MKYRTSKLINTLALIVILMLAIPVGISANSNKKGVAGPGGCPSTLPLPPLYHTLGATWSYSWAYCDWETGIEYVPMVRSIHSFDIDNANRMVSRYGTGAYWLIGNEPDNGGQDNLTAKDAAKKYGEIAQIILGTDPTAKLIMLGLTSGDWDGREYLKKFRLEWKSRWGFDVDKVVTGWHIHSYAHVWGSYDTQDKAIAREKTYIQAFRIAIDLESPNAELWITEYGTIYGPYANTARVMNVMTPWLENYSGVDRYAWFYFGHPNCDWNGTALYTCAKDISPLGSLYASFTFPVATASPTKTITPRPTFTLTPTQTPIRTLTPTLTSTLIPSLTLVASVIPSITSTPSVAAAPSGTITLSATIASSATPAFTPITIPTMPTVIPSDDWNTRGMQHLESSLRIESYILILLSLLADLISWLKVFILISLGVATLPKAYELLKK